MEEFKQLLVKSQTAYNAAKAAAEYLLAKGFRELSLSDDWCIYPEKEYFTRVYDGTVIAFRTGNKFGYQDIIKIATAHTDHPCLSIKMGGTMNQNGYRRLNVEVYGGAILNTWLDRPLGIGGIVALKGMDVFSPRMEIIDIHKPILFIPNLAIHMNRDVNKGVAINQQTELAPIIEHIEQDAQREDYLLDIVAKELKIAKDEILDMQLYAYVLAEPVLVGAKEEFLMAPAIDNIASVYACLSGIASCKNEHNLNMIALFDHEEVGNGSKQGAGSDILQTVIRKIFLSLGRTEENIIESIHDGFLLSLDGAHGVHPAYAQKSDPVNEVLLNKGVVIKKAARQSYCTDCESSAIVMQLCQSANIPYQIFYNRSDIPGGSTLGNVASTNLSMRAADVGIPMLAMHSAVETMGVKDEKALEMLVKEFFK